MRVEVDFDFFVSGFEEVERVVKGRLRRLRDDELEVVVEGDGEGFRNSSRVVVDDLRGVFTM